MARFFVSRDNIKQEFIYITGDDVNHIKNVLRLKPGTEVNICDGSSQDYLAVIESFENDVVKTRITDRIGNANETKLKVSLFQGIPKSDKMDSIIQKNVELGIYEVYPVITDRTVVKIESDSAGAKKTERWQRIAYEAAKQCQRGIVPKVSAPIDFKDAVKKASALTELTLIPCLSEKNIRLRSILQNAAYDSISVFIGPEGGFSDSEVELAASYGAVPVTLGPRVLRTETAGFVVLSAIMYELGELG